MYRVTLLLLSCLATAWPALAGGFDPDKFENWVSMRVGSGDPVYWYSTGTLRAYPGGRLLAHIEGYDTARLLSHDAGAEAVQGSRKVYRYLDPETGAAVTDSAGAVVAPIAYPYQLISYELEGDRLITWVEQGAGERLQRIGPGNSIEATPVGAGILFSAPLFLDMETPRGRYQTFEHYDFYYPPADDLDSSYITFVRYGDAPAWADADKAVMHMSTRRLSSYEAVPAAFRAWIEKEMPLWREPPATLDEIRALQVGQSP